MKEVIAAPEGGSLRFADETQWSKFELGAACAVFLWDDLATAVASGWGGPESEAKREWLAGVVVDLFEGEEVAIEDIEVTLLGAMEDEFDAVVETGTAIDVARQILQLYEDCANNKFELTQELFERFQRMQPAKKVNNEDVPEIIESESSDSGDEIRYTYDEDFGGGGNDDGDDDDDAPNAMEVDEEPKQGPIVDEDGFTLVQKKGKPKA